MIYNFLQLLSFFFFRYLSRINVKRIINVDFGKEKQFVNLIKGLDSKKD